MSRTQVANTNLAGGITPDKLSTGAPNWDTSSNLFAGNSVTSPVGVFGGSGQQVSIGNVAEGYYGDGSNLALRTPTNGTIFFQNYNGIANYGFINGGGLTINNGATINNGTTVGIYASNTNSEAIGVGTEGAAGVEIRSGGATQGGGASFMSFHRPGTYAVRFGLDTDNKLKVGGWSMGNASYEIFHDANAASKNVGSATLASKSSTIAADGGDGAPMTFNWNGQEGQPSWLWGGNDGQNMYVYSPSNFRVSYANTAGYAANSGDMTGAVAAFAMSYPPTGWLYCDGSALPTTSYPNLFARIQYLYGGGGGTFNLPDLRGVFVRGIDYGRGLDPSRGFGTFQDHAFGSHSHGVYDPGHSHGVYDPGHAHSFIFCQGDDNLMGGYGWAQSVGVGIPDGWGSPHELEQAGNPQGARLGYYHGITSYSGTGIGIYGAGTGIGIYNSGSNETRPRNVAMLYCIKY